MKKDRLVHLSKFLSKILRHDPSVVGISLDANGWVDCGVLLKACADHGKNFSLAELKDIVEDNDKKRFELQAYDHGYRIRAQQGHSVAVDLELKPQAPPSILYHGTASRLLETIRCEGLKKMNRNHVHLSANKDVAYKVGARHGKPLVLQIDSKKMCDEGFYFYISGNGVWLTEHVPSRFITHPQSSERVEAVFEKCQSPVDLSTTCWNCGNQMIPVHGHYACEKCGWRDSCCQ